MGAALYESLKKNYSVKTFSRSNPNSERHKIFNFLETERFSGLDLFQDTVVFAIPMVRSFDLCRVPFQKFLEKMQKKSHFIYISSTSVFAENQGLCDEATEPRPSSIRGKSQLALEKMIEDTLSNYTIVRSAGQIGGGRFPEPSTREKSDPSRRLNLIDQVDLVNIISHVINSNSKPRMVHAVAPYHPTRGEYYFGDKPPEQQCKKKKVVKSDYLSAEGFLFKNPKLYWKSTSQKEI